MKKEVPVEERIRKSFLSQGLMATIGAELVSVEVGKVVIACPLSDKVTQQNGFFHAGVLTSLVDTACGYAALTVMPEDRDVLSVEFKINLLKPAIADSIYAVGRVLQKGRKLVICEGEVLDEKREKVFAKMMATMINVERQ